MSEGSQEDITTYVSLLEERGPQLPYPYCSRVFGSRHEHMRELRVQSAGRPLRVYYAFDPERSAILLMGGEKTGDGRFYLRMTPLADRLYDEHSEALKNEKQG